LPDDHRIRCSAARAEYVLGVHEPIHRLRADPEVHVALANRYRKAAQDSMANDNPALGANKYLKALTEYQEAIDREPTHIEALTAYTLPLGEWRANLVALANRHRKAAQDGMADGDFALDTRSYLMALTEYQEAIDREPTHIEALTGYAFTFEE